jgi:hypothetical protein
MPMTGTDADGFTISFEEPSRCLRIRVYGFWQPDTAATFVASLVDACRPPRRAVELVVDASDLKPQRDEAQVALKDAFAALPGLGITRASVVTDNALTKLQLLRLVNAGPARAIIRFVRK